MMARLFGLLLLMVALDAGALNCTSAATGNWNAPGTWINCGGGVPGVNDTVTIAGNRTVTIPAGYTAQAKAVDIGSNAQGSANALTLAASTSVLNVGSGPGLTCTVSVCVNRPSNNNINALNVNAGTVNVGTVAAPGNLSFVGTATNTNRIAQIVITSGTVTVTGSMDFNAPAAATNAVNTIDMSGGAGKFNLGGAFLVDDVTRVGRLVSSATSKFNYNGTAAQTVVMNAFTVSSVVYNHVYVNNTSASGATLSAAVTTTRATGSLRIGVDTDDTTLIANSLLNDNGFAITGGAGDTFRIGAGSTFQTSRVTQSVTGYSTLDLGNDASTACGTYEYVLAGAQTVAVPAVNYGNLKLSGSGAKTLPATALTVNCDFVMASSATATLLNNLTVGRDFSMAGTSQFDAGTSANGAVAVTRDMTLAGNSFNARSFTHTVGRNFSNTLTTFTPSTSTFNFNGTVAQGISGATTFNNLTISNTAATVTANAAHTVNATLTIASNATLADGGNALTAKANVANSGTHSGAGKILLSGGTAQHQLSGTGTYQNLELNDANGAALTAGPTVNGTLTLTAGTLADGGNTLTAKGNVSNSATHSGTGKILLTAGSAQHQLGGSGSGAYGNLELNDSANGAALTANATVNGTLTLTAGTLADGGNTLTAKGNISNSATHSGSGKIALTGGTAQHQLSGSGSGTYGNLELNDSNGAAMTANATVSSTLTLTAGILATGSANTLTLSANCPGSVARTGGWVAGNLRMKFPTSGAADCTFHIGDTATNYTPIRTNFSSLSGSGNSRITATVTPPDHPDTAVTSTSGRNGINPAKSVNRYWTLKNDGVGGSYTATMTYIGGVGVDIDAAATQANFKAARGTGCATSGGVRTCYPWGLVGTVTNPTGTSTQVSGLTLLANTQETDFAIGESATPRFVREKEFIYSRELY